MYNYQSCPVCDNNKFSHYLDTKDYSVSKEEFSISKCDSCGFVFTNPRPEEKDLSKYYKSENYISHTNTSKGLINTLYKLVRNYTLKTKHSLIKPYMKDGYVLDIGAGTGAFIRVLKDRGVNAIGVEPDEDARGTAKKDHNVDLKEEGYIDSIPDFSCDVITMWHVLEHVPRLNDRVKQLKSKLSKEGIVVIAVPNHESPDAVYYKKFWAAYDVPRHLYHFDKQSIKSLFKKHNLDLVEVRPMPFDAFYVSMLSERFLGSKGFLPRAIFQGLKTLLFSPTSNSSSLTYIFRHENSN